jgi:mRNA-degrading endonuclease RelE of RelBE toxin-antitoxin system
VAVLYSVIWESRARRNRDALPADVVKAITELGEALAADPRPYGSIQMKGRRDKLRRVRAASYRLMYYVDDTARTVTIIDADHRKDIYR